MTFQERHDAAGARYAAAVLEFRAAYVALAAHDRKAGTPGFGLAVEIIPLRHTKYLPDLAGSFTDGIGAAVAALAT